MAMTCSICRHPHRTDIETGLLKGRPLRDIESQWRVSRSALSRHQEAGHVTATVRSAHRAGEAARGQTLLDQVDELKGRVTAVLDRAEAEDNPKLALMAARELRGCLDLLGRVMGDLNPGTTTVNVLLSPQWLQIRSTLFSALDVYPDARIAVVRALSDLRPEA